MRKEYFWQGLSEIPQFLVGVVIVYLLIIIYTKIFGLKSFSKMTSFDFAHTIAVGSLIAATIANAAPSIAVGGILILGLYAMNYAISFAQKQNGKLEKWVENDPIMLMRDGKILYDNLEKSFVTENELRSKLREANVLQLSKVRAMILESTGDVSVLHGEVEVDEYILTGVRTN